MSNTGETEVTIHYFGDAHDGPGWYWWESDYREDGCTGSFATRDDAEANARASYSERHVLAFTYSGGTAA